MGRRGGAYRRQDAQAGPGEAGGGKVGQEGVDGVPRRGEHVAGRVVVVVVLEAGLGRAALLHAGLGNGREEVGAVVVGAAAEGGVAAELEVLGHLVGDNGLVRRCQAGRGLCVAQAVVGLVPQLEGNGSRARGRRRVVGVVSAAAVPGSAAADAGAAHLGGPGGGRVGDGAALAAAGRGLGGHGRRGGEGRRSGRALAVAAAVAMLVVVGNQAALVVGFAEAAEAADELAERAGPAGLLVLAGGELLLRRRGVRGGEGTHPWGTSYVLWAGAVGVDGGRAVV